MTSFYNEEELYALGLHHWGNDVLISRNAKLYGAHRISIGNHVRIDDFCILSGTINIGNYVHIAASACLFAGDAGIILEDYVGISSRSALYAATDDYSGKAMTNPMVPEELRCVTAAAIRLQRHTLVGTGCTVLPGVTLAEGTSVGAMSLINRDTLPWSIYYGVPAIRHKERDQVPLALCTQLPE